MADDEIDLDAILDEALEEFNDERPIPRQQAPPPVTVPAGVPPPSAAPIPGGNPFGFPMPNIPSIAGNPPSQWDNESEEQIKKELLRVLQSAQLLPEGAGDKEIDKLVDEFSNFFNSNNMLNDMIPNLAAPAPSSSSPAPTSPSPSSKVAAGASSTSPVSPASSTSSSSSSTGSSRNLRDASIDHVLESLSESSKNVPKLPDQEDDIMRLLDDLNNPEIQGLMEGFVKKFMSKDVLLDSMRDIKTELQEWINTVDKSTVSSEDLSRHQSQLRIAGEICNIFEQLKDDQELSGPQSDRVQALMAEYQGCGLLPSPVLSKLAPGVELDAEGKPKLPADMDSLMQSFMGAAGGSGGAGGAPPPECSIM